MNTIIPIYHPEEDQFPYTVKVNGKVLMGKRGERRFKDSFAAAIAGAKEVDRLRAAEPQPEKP